MFLLASFDTLFVTFRIDVIFLEIGPGELTFADIGDTMEPSLVETRSPLRPLLESFARETRCTFSVLPALICNYKTHRNKGYVQLESWKRARDTPRVISSFLIFRHFATTVGERRITEAVRAA